MPFNLSDIGGILFFTTVAFGFCWAFSNSLPFAPLALLAGLTFIAFSCAAIDK